MYNKIFSRGKINGVELKNRVIMGPMDESLGDNSGNVSPRCMEYFLARAKGGTAALVTSYVAVCPKAGKIMTAVRDGYDRIKVL